MSASVDRYDGRLLNTAISINYRLSDYAGFGLSHNMVDLDVTMDKTNWIGRWDIRFAGTFAFLSFHW